MAASATATDRSGDAPHAGFDIVNIAVGYDPQGGVLSATFSTLGAPDRDADYFVEFYARVGSACRFRPDRGRGRIGLLDGNHSAFGFKWFGDEAGESTAGTVQVRGNQLSLRVKSPEFRYRSFECARAFVLRPTGAWAEYDASEVLRLQLAEPVQASAALRCSRRSAFGATADSVGARRSVRRAGVITDQDLFDVYAVGPVLCRDLDGDGATEMGVVLRCCTVSSYSPLLVFRRSEQGWRLAFSRSKIQVWRASTRPRQFVLTYPVYKRRDPNCCPSRVGRRIVESSKRGAIRIRRAR